VAELNSEAPGAAGVASLGRFKPALNNSPPEEKSWGACEQWLFFGRKHMGRHELEYIARWRRIRLPIILNCPFIGAVSPLW